MRVLSSALVVVGALAVPGAASACDEPSAGCGPWYEQLGDGLVSTIATATVVLLVGTALAVPLVARRRRVHRVLSLLLGLQVVGLLGAAVALAAIRA